ncbi:MAG: transaldolase B [Candidatus Westeberhardia cardiocondylae]|nr:transaldolase B [Candidatus Westeberhardia cardiocondylae]
MTNKLNSLKKITTIVTDSSNIQDIKHFKPQDATTNPSLILNAIQKTTEYQHHINNAIQIAKLKYKTKNEQAKHAAEQLAVNIGTEILKIIPGKISTEIDSHLSYNIEKSINKSKEIIKLYNKANINNNRILIKLAATWQGIKAAEILEKEGIHCNLTLLFSFAQAKACAEAGVYLISPFVGRILDWYKNTYPKKIFTKKNDPGVKSLTKIYQYYKKYNYETIIMGASFRNIEEILSLAGCDKLTISPHLLKELENTKGKVEKKLHIEKNLIQQKKPEKLNEEEFLWQHHQDTMAINSLSQGIINFANDQKKLQYILFKMI